MGTRGDWSKAFLLALGNASPSEKIINFVASWTKAENTEARFNPLATTLDYGTNTKFNSANVRNYQSREQGIQASVMTLNGNHAGYANLKRALLANDGNAALSSGGLDTWGSGSSRVSVIWGTSDVRNEALLSETATHTPEVIRPETGAINPLGPEAGGKDTYTPVPTETGTVTGTAVKMVLKRSLAAGIAVTGIILFVIGIVKSDSAKSAIDIAKVVAV